MRRTFLAIIGLFAFALLSHSFVNGQTPVATPIRRPAQVSAASPTAKATSPKEEGRKAQPSVQNAKLILPDLVIKQIKLLPGSGLNPKRGLGVLIANVGEADASSTFYLRLVLKRKSSASQTGQPSYDGKDTEVAVMTAPLAKGAARWVNFETLKILNDGSNNEIYSVTATVDAGVTVTTVTSVWPPKGTSKTEGPFVKESNENNNTLSPDPDAIAP